MTTSNTIVFSPSATKKDGRTPNQLVADANTASYALAKAILDHLRPAHGSNWGDVGDANHVAAELLKLYASVSNRDSGDSFNLPTDDGRSVAFTLTDF